MTPLHSTSAHLTLPHTCGSWAVSSSGSSSLQSERIHVCLKPWQILQHLMSSACNVHQVRDRIYLQQNLRQRMQQRRQTKQWQQRRQRLSQWQQRQRQR